MINSMTGYGEAQGEIDGVTSIRMSSSCCGANWRAER